MDRRSASLGESLAEHYQALLDVLESIAATRDLPSLCRDLAQRLPAAVPSDFIGLVFHDPAKNVMKLTVLERAVTDRFAAQFDGLELPIEGSSSGWVWMSQQPLIVPLVSEDSRFPVGMAVLRDIGVQSACFLPLTTAMRRLGAIGFGSRDPCAFGDKELAFLGRVAKQVAVAVDNVLNYASAEALQQALIRERDRLSLLLEINNAIVSRLDLPALLKVISTCLRRVIPHDLAGLALYDSSTHQLLSHALDFPGNQDFVGLGVPIPLEGTPEGLAFTSRQTVLIKRLSLTEFPAEIVKRAAAEGLKSGCAVPLISHERVVGTLSAVSLRHEAFSEDDAAILGRIGTQVAIAVENSVAYREIAELKDKLSQEKLYLEDEIQTEHNFKEIIGESLTLKKVLKEMEIVAPTDSTVLILGETGTGKELLARAIHNLSRRRERTFVKMNCAAIPSGLLESELFGHERGAFTGAIAAKVGRFELANGGTLFLDEVGDIPVELQSKLLRVLQEQEFERLGSTRTLKVNVRLVAATNQDLSAMVKQKEFRSDLYYRLNVFPLVIPPLRERADDVPLLVRYFVQKFARQLNRPIERIPMATLEALKDYDRPGNIRELENLIERAVILTQGRELRVPLAELQSSIVDNSPPLATLDATEREHILRVLKETRWVIGGPSGAASRLGMKRTTLQSKMQRLGIVRPT